MKLLLFLFVADAAFCAGWEAVQKLLPNAKVIVATAVMPERRGSFVSANETTLVIQSKAGQHAVERADILRVRVADPARRGRNGLIATAIGAGIGLGVGFAICPYCANEGSGWRFTGPLTAAGAGVGTAGFLPLPYRTIHKAK